MNYGIPKGILLNFKLNVPILRCTHSRVGYIKKLTKPNTLCLTQLKEFRSAVTIQKLQFAHSHFYIALKR